ncbi:phage portal protein [Bacillus sp. AG4(2022)]|uniref:phage portal protein n=1 Tax=Bacillus sp. AG4(2022) TaxID=2962594 RepID=UPI0028825F41|nr:phage portal protein [Bacillus sp. AG4(2022)]MDT0163827.1 phage portal protein [Bacillus sp. AG4(2022)]
MQIRSIFGKIFGEEPKRLPNETQFKFMNGFTPVFTHFGEDPYTSDVVRSAIHVIASNAAKLKPKHIRRLNKDVTHVSGQLERLLSVRPNEFMSAYDFIYKVVTQRELFNNAFIYIKWDLISRQVSGFYPVDMASVELVEAQDTLFVKFQFPNGKKFTAPYSDFIHLRKFYNRNDMFGESNAKALLPTLDLIHTTDEGIANAVKSSAFLRGLLKFTQAMLKPEDIKKQRDAFVQDYMDVSNNGGIAALDAKAEYQELKSDPKMVDDKQMGTIEEKVHKYFNVNKKIIMSNYNEVEWDAFYENVLEPIALQMSLEFTSKLFTDRAQGHGNEIIFEANRLQYASIKTKVQLIKETMTLGILSKNEAREIFNLSPIEGGDEYIQTLNVVNADKADDYQLGEEKQSEGGEDDDEGEANSEDGEA